MQDELRELALCFYRLYLRRKRKTNQYLREILMADFSVLNANVAQLKTDAEALIAKVGVEDPQIQVAINQAAADVAAIDDEVKAKLG